MGGDQESGDARLLKRRYATIEIEGSEESAHIAVLCTGIARR